MRFSRWQVGEIVGRNKSGTPIYHCVCDCGTVRDMIPDRLLNGSSRSCGCLARELASQRRASHRMTHHPLYSLWANIKYRCYNPRCKMYPLYGGRGIVMCDRWRGDFMAFLADMGNRPEGMSIDRIDTNGPYSPENCRWATDVVQHRNTRTNHIVEFNGKRQTLSAWAEELGFSKTLLNNRIRLGWSIEDMLTIPPGTRTRWNR